MDRKSIMSIITEYGIDQEILDHIFIYDEYIKTEFMMSILKRTYYRAVYHIWSVVVGTCGAVRTVTKI